MHTPWSCFLIKPRGQVSLLVRSGEFESARNRLRDFQMARNRTWSDRFANGWPRNGLGGFGNGLRAPNGPEMAWQLPRQTRFRVSFCLTERTSRRTTKGTVTQLYMSSTCVSVAACEAWAGIGRRAAVTSPQPKLFKFLQPFGF